MNFLERNARFWSEKMRSIPEPHWSTPHQVVYETETEKLIDFSTDDEGIPTLILPPQAGGHSNIADYDPPKASLVTTCLQNGRTNLFCVEYKPATQSTKYQTIGDLVKNTRDIVDYLGGRVRLICLCQGVWQGAIFTALFPHMVEDLILTAGPIDFHADEHNAIFKAVMNTPLWVAESILQANNGIWPGDMQSNGFKMMDPVKKIGQAASDLYWNLDNPEWLERNRRFTNWFDHRQDLAGAWVMQALKELFRGNRLVRGELAARGRIVGLEDISCPITVMWADKDDITSPDQLRNIKKFVKVPVREIEIKNCGHIGAFNSSKSLAHAWPAALGVQYE